MQSESAVIKAPSFQNKKNWLKIHLADHMYFKVLEYTRSPVYMKQE